MVAAPPPAMNLPRLVLTIVGGFIFIFASDFLIHAVWLADDYKATADMWRSEAEMEARFGWMVFAQFLAAIAFAVVWAKGFAGRSLGAGATFGFFMGLALQSWSIVFHVVAPLPASIAGKWFLSGLLQAILLGIIVAAVYRPSTTRVS